MSLSQAPPGPRRFGRSKPPPRPTSSGSNSSSHHSSLTATPNGSSVNLFGTLQPPQPAGENHRRSSSFTNNLNPAFDSFESAADRSLAWLHTWAPKGEGRGREFLSNTLNGVVTVAGAVGSGIGEIGAEGLQRAGLSRPSSFNNAAASASAATTSPPISSSSNGSVSPPLSEAHAQLPRLSSSISPPNALQSRSTSDLPIQVGRKIPQPSNLARLTPNSAQSRPSISHPATSTSVPTAPSVARASSSTAAPQQVHTGPHGPSHLNPRRPSASAHSRSPSIGLGVSPQPGGVSRSSSRATTNAAGGLRAGMPYKIGFQPQGVRNDRTADYMDERRKWSDERDKEEGRLGRRWAKLVELHFNPTTMTDSPLPTLPRSTSNSSFLSATGEKRRSMLSLDGAIDAMKVRDMWKGLKGATAPPNAAEDARKRAAEQAIVKWEDDAEVKKCRICQSSFSLSNRKHHCRVCGRIVCSLPPTPPALLAVQVQLFSPADPSAVSHPATSKSQDLLPPGTRQEKCSLLLVADWKSGRGEEVEEGFVGWMKTGPEDASLLGSPGRSKLEKRRSRVSIASSSAGSSGSKGDGDLPLPQQPKEVQVRGIRVCRECWATVSRKQKMADRSRVGGYARLYHMLRNLQAEIENLMPDYEDALSELSVAEPVDPPPPLIKMHKDLLTLFQQYEHLSKRLSSLPCEEGSSQATVQGAVARSAASFLGKEMLKLQALPKLQKRAVEAKRRSVKMQVLETNLDSLGLSGTTTEAEEDVASTLQPLLEQEAQLEVYMTEANAQRKYEDAKALSEALREIRAEIARVTSRAMR